MSADPLHPAPASSADGLASLFANAGKAGGVGKGPAPVEKWNPPYCGAIDMRIAADGTWFYMGSPIGREAMVRLFASVLRKDEDGETYLVTPVERCGIRVDDAPFLAVEMHSTGEGETQRLTFRTNVGDIVEAGPDHALRFSIDTDHGGVKPYILVRGRLEARINRPVTYQMLDLGSEHDVHGRRWFGVWSGQIFFPIQPAEDIA
jgi:hypothetical protein